MNNNDFMLEKIENKIKLLKGSIRYLEKEIENVFNFNGGKYLPKGTVLAIKDSNENCPYKFFELDYHDFKGKTDNKPEAWFWFDTNNAGYWFRGFYFNYCPQPTILIEPTYNLQLFTLNYFSDCKFNTYSGNKLDIERLYKSKSLSDWELFIPNVECRNIEVEELTFYKTLKRKQKELEELMKSEESMGKQI